MNYTVQTGTLYGNLQSQVQNLCCLKKSGSYTLINFSVGEIIEVQPNKIIQKQSVNLEGLKGLR